jgi:hypothetical protein
MRLRRSDGYTKEGQLLCASNTCSAMHYLGLEQALYVCNYNNWYAIANINNDARDGAIKTTSPNVQETGIPRHPS